MPELEPAQNSSDAPDPIAGLHKMSTTAGVGSQDYVAINNAAIVSVILGLCTALAFLGIPFLIVGAAGIVFGIIAIVQIRHSNGTQGGMGLAVLGILLSLAIAGSVAAAQIIEWRHQEQDKADINKTLSQVGQYLASAQYDKAYQQFSPEFQSNFGFQLFHDQLQVYQQFLGKIEAMTSNDVFIFLPTADGVPTAQTQTIVSFHKPTTQATQPFSSEPRRIPTGLYKRNGQWYIAAMEIFRKPATPAGPAGPAAP
jgi:hypothetical protein